MTGEQSTDEGMDCLDALLPFVSRARDEGGIADLKLVPSERSDRALDLIVVPYRPADTDWVTLPAGVRDVLAEHDLTPAVSVRRRGDRPVFRVAQFPGTLGPNGVSFRTGPIVRSVNGP